MWVWFQHSVVKSFSHMPIDRQISNRTSALAWIGRSCRCISTKISLTLDHSCCCSCCGWWVCHYSLQLVSLFRRLLCMLFSASLTTQWLMWMLLEVSAVQISYTCHLPSLTTDRFNTARYLKLIKFCCYAFFFWSHMAYVVKPLRTKTVERVWISNYQSVSTRCVWLSTRQHIALVFCSETGRDCLCNVILVIGVRQFHFNYCSWFIVRFVNW